MGILPVIWLVAPEGTKGSHWKRSQAIAPLTKPPGPLPFGKNKWQGDERGRGPGTGSPEWKSPEPRLPDSGLDVLSHPRPC